MPYKNNKREDGDIYFENPDGSPRKKKETQVRFEFSGVSISIAEFLIRKLVMPSYSQSTKSQSSSSLTTN